MAKISPVSIKYLIKAKLKAQGTVEKPDVIGAVFGQTEGLLGEELELRELQKEGKVGRIEVTLDPTGDGTEGIIEIPTSMDKAETALIAAALETIERIGPSESVITVESIEDVRSTKREYVLERAKKLLKGFETTDSAVLTETIVSSKRTSEIIEYGKDKLPAGPEVQDGDEIIIVEGRADVVNLLKHGINNAIAMSGTKIPETIIEISHKKEVTLFVDGDRGGDLITKEVLKKCDIDDVVKAPDGKEVEELTQKEILKTLRGKVEVSSLAIGIGSSRAKSYDDKDKKGSFSRGRERTSRTSERVGSRTRSRDYTPRENRYSERRREMKPEEKEVFKEKMEELLGTRGAYILDNDLEILGKVPVSELASVLNNVQAYAVIADGKIDGEMSRAAEKAKVKCIVAKGFEGEIRGAKKATPDELG